MHFCKQISMCGRKKNLIEGGIYQQSHNIAYWISMVKGGELGLNVLQISGPGVVDTKWWILFCHETRNILLRFIYLPLLRSCN